MAVNYEVIRKICENECMYRDPYSRRDRYAFEACVNWCISRSIFQTVNFVNS